jgi:hypothetical protein
MVAGISNRYVAMKLLFFWVGLLVADTQHIRSISATGYRWLQHAPIDGRL